jgi:hypothetical protein
MANRNSLSTSERKLWRALDRTLRLHGDRLDPRLSLRGKEVILPRTNNISEVGFRDFKRRQRRTTGNGNLSRQLDHTPAQNFYAANLECATYRRIVFGNRTLTEALADIDRKQVLEQVAAMKAPPAVGIIDHELINREDFLLEVVARFKSECPAIAS